MKSMKFLVTSFLVILFFSACKKFVHEDIEAAIPSCELCAWADSLEGEYDGYYNYTVNGSIGQFTSIDSLHFSVQHIFLNKGPLDDSTRMFFQVTRTGGSDTPDDVSIWVVDDSLGIFLNTGFDEIRMNRDSIYMRDFESQSGFGGSTAGITKNGVFYRQ